MYKALATATSLLELPLLQVSDNADEIPPNEYAMAGVKILLTLVALIILFSITVWFLRRLIRHRLEKGGAAQAIRVVDKKMISPKTMLYVLEIEGERIVIAESQLEVRQLKKAPVAEEPENYHALS